MSETVAARIDAVARQDGPAVRAALVASFRDLELAEDALQEALLAAAERWPDEGLPESPRAWLLTVARRRALDVVRRDQSFAARRHLAVEGAPLDPTRLDDEELELILLCCDSVLPVPLQVALTLQAVAGLSAEQIARAFLVTPSTMGQRLVRAKRVLQGATGHLGRPGGPALGGRLEAARAVVYLIFNEGYAPSRGEAVLDVDLCDEAIRLARRLCRLVPQDGETLGLLCLLLLQHSRRATRVDAAGDLVLLAEQDRRHWDRASIAEATAMLSRALRLGPAGKYRIEAAIAAVHAEAPSADATDWPQVVGLYDLLWQRAPSPTVALNRAVARAMAGDLAGGLAELETLADDPRLARSHLLAAARGELMLRQGLPGRARLHFDQALALAPTAPERRHLGRRLLAIGRLAPGHSPK